MWLPSVAELDNLAYLGCPDGLTLGDMRCPDPLTHKVIQALRAARRLAWERHHRHLAPEHLLLALARMGPTVARWALDRLGLDLTREEGPISALVAAVPPEAQEGEPPAAPALVRLVELAKGAAKSLGHNYVGTEHLVLGMLACGGPAGELLAERGIRPEAFRAALRELFSGRWPPEEHGP